MKILVMKFGGTFLSDESGFKNAVEIVRERIGEGYRPVVVVSASGRKGAPYATDTLLNLASQINPKIKTREKDLISSCGEIISAVLLVQYLELSDLQAKALNGAQAGIVTENSNGSCRIKYINCISLAKILEDRIIPVVAGYQGISETGEISTLERGGSDVSASAIGSALKADKIEIYTDVAGVMTADPLKVDNSRLVTHLSYQEIVELAYLGAKVIHPRAVELAEKAGIPIWIKKNNSSETGSVIHHFEQQRTITGITSRDDISHVRIIPDQNCDYNSCLDVFDHLGKVGISVDFINIRPDEISFVINSVDLKQTKGILEEKRYDFEVRKDFVKISLVGNGMTGKPGVLAKIVKVLKKNKIAIYETTDSHTTISCLIDRDKELTALNSLHEDLVL